MQICTHNFSIRVYDEDSQLEYERCSNCGVDNKLIKQFQKELEKEGNERLQKFGNPFTANWIPKEYWRK